eukprot:8984540-Alexandrium_andersonii.AAC.1
MVKLQFCQENPYLLIGLGHHGAEKARECGRRALQKWDALSPHAQAVQHRVVRLFLSRDAPCSLRVALEALVAGGDLGESPELE